MSTYYLSGPMRGIPRWNFPAFHSAAKFYRSQGHTVISPAEHDESLGLDPVTYPSLPARFKLEDALRWDLEQVCLADGIIMLEGWEDSEGAKKEKTVAEWTGREVRFDVPAYAHVRGVDGPGAYERAERAVFEVMGFNDGSGVMRTFDTGATRSSDADKLDYEGFLSPYALEEYAKYLHKNRVQADGNVRDSDNWQKGIPKSAYMKSMFRHFLAAWRAHREGGDPTEDLCAVLFNAMGFLHEGHKP